MEIYENLFQGSTDEPEVDAPKYDNFEPLNDLVLVKRYQEDNSTKGGFIVPEKFRQQSNRGIVVRISYEVGSCVSPGDLVTFGIGNAETLVINGEEHLLIRANDLRGVERAL